MFAGEGGGGAGGVWQGVVRHDDGEDGKQSEKPYGVLKIMSAYIESNQKVTDQSKAFYTDKIKKEKTKQE